MFPFIIIRSSINSSAFSTSVSEKNRDFTNDIIIGIEKDSSSNRWQWARGGNFEASKGEYPFGAGKPDDGDDKCARMQHEYAYHLNDKDCDTQ